ncbi:hypothetical protein, partial [Escherichia coli]|uniref:hypothetical protein n=1 Tax=Escherichia coli TaxID=562 RepID=UPI00200D76D7
CPIGGGKPTFGDVLGVSSPKGLTAFPAGFGFTFSIWRTLDPLLTEPNQFNPISFFCQDNM